MTEQQRKNRRTILIIFAMTIIPFCFAWFLSKNSELLNKGVKNNGELVVPVITTERNELTGYDAFSQENIDELKGHWLLVNIIPNNECNAVCLYAILKTKQLRVMLNKELSRTRRVAIVFKPLDAQKAEQLWLKDALLSRLGQKQADKNTHKAETETLYTRLLEPENRLDESLLTKFITEKEDKALAMKTDLIRVKPSASMIEKITKIRKGVIPEGMLFLFDPLGNIMMQYEPEFDTYKVRDDLKKLLRYSQIG